MYLDLFGADDAPAALGLHPAHGGVTLRSDMTHAVAMGNLEEAILRDDRPDADRLEQNIVPRITPHGNEGLTAWRSERRRQNEVKSYGGFRSAETTYFMENSIACQTVIAAAVGIVLRASGDPAF